MDVMFPGGTRIRALSLFERKEDDSTRDYGLYLEQRWKPTWPADIVDWPDHGVPVDNERAVEQIEDAWTRALSGEVVEIGCFAGIGRTGVVLACFAILAGIPPDEAVAWVRTNYRPVAVETSDQEQWVLWFGEHLRAQG
jgi:protein-tyrosine phosphatase